jgi:cell division protein FtsB
LISTAFSLSWAALLRPLWLSKVGAGAVHPISWRKSYGGMKVDQAKRLKELEAENARLKRAVADLTVDKLILKEVAEGKY